MKVTLKSYLVRLQNKGKKSYNDVAEHSGTHLQSQCSGGRSRGDLCVQGQPGQPELHSKTLLQSKVCVCMCKSHSVFSEFTFLLLLLLVTFIAVLSFHVSCRPQVRHT